MENHDAIVDASIKQTRQAVAKTKARINTLRQQQNVYEKQLNEAKEQHALWTERAKSLAASDQDKALQCVSRRNQFSTEMQRLACSAEQQKELIREVSTNLQKLQGKLDEMVHKHNLMRSRQTVADVNRVVAHADQDQNLRDTFERWESVVLEHEFAVSDVCNRDSLDMELSEQEDEIALLAQLIELTAQSESKADTDNLENKDE
jgi:phage shock protein A